MHKYVRTHQDSSGNRFGNAFIVSGYSHTMEAFQQLLKEARKHFPGLTESDVECRTVIKSGWCDGCAVLRFPCEPDTKKHGWLNVEKLPDIVC